MTPTTNKLIPVALIAALLGGTAGAFMTRSTRTTEPSTTATAPATSGETAKTAEETNLASASDLEAYRTGFNDGFSANSERNQFATTNTVTRRVNRPVVYRNARSSTSSRRAYYDYQQPRSRSFWQKHRDKLTVAMGAGGGALVGGLLGGKKGAAIGALAGGGGSALYTYKIRNRNRQY
jgi:hypothetical protein